MKGVNYMFQITLISKGLNLPTSKNAIETII